MEALISVYNWLAANKGQIVSGIAHLCLFASIIVKLTPTLKDDDYLKPVIKFIGKFIALDKFPAPKDK